MAASWLRSWALNLRISGRLFISSIKNLRQGDHLRFDLDLLLDCKAQVLAQPHGIVQGRPGNGEIILGLD